MAHTTFKVAPKGKYQVRFSFHFFVETGGI